MSYNEKDHPRDKYGKYTNKNKSCKPSIGLGGSNTLTSDYSVFPNSYEEYRKEQERERLDSLARSLWGTDSYTGVFRVVPITPTLNFRGVITHGTQHHSSFLCVAELDVVF